MGDFEIAVLVGWAIAIWAFCSVLFSDPAKFRSLGRSKGRWLLIELAAFIPYFGFIAVLFYVFKVRVHFPPRPEKPSRPAPSSTSGSSSSQGRMRWEACPPCGGKGFRPCPTCGGRGTMLDGRRCPGGCGGSGGIRCYACQGQRGQNVPY
jgi:hypothetical protein